MSNDGDFPLAEKDAEDLVRRAAEVLRLSAEEGISLAEAASRLDMPAEVVEELMHPDKAFSDFLGDFAEASDRLVKYMAANFMPQVLAYQAKIASGEVNVPRANPTEAARFIAEVAKSGIAESEEKINQINFGVFIPQFGGPNHGSEEATVVEAEFREDD